MLYSFSLVCTALEAVTRLRAREIGLREAQRYYGVPTRTLKRRIESGNITAIAQGPLYESGVQLINKVGHVIIKNGAKVVHKLTTGEKGETNLQIKTGCPYCVSHLTRLTLCSPWTNNILNVGRKLTRYQVGPLICSAWNKSTSVGNGTAGLKSTGIYPLNRQFIPDNFFSISDNMISDSSVINPPPTERPRPTQPLQTSLQPSCSRDAPVNLDVQGKPETPSKYLNKILPAPQLKQSKKPKKGAVLLTSSVNRNLLKDNLQKKEAKEMRRAGSKTKGPKENPAAKNRKEDDIETIPEVNVGKECKKHYNLTKQTYDWLRCASCKRWLHEACTIFEEFCVDCGRQHRDKN
ncbi:hypothetical protein J6590_077756 [Homalodisca vitripennis]|nr:hypothetical protein J6590_077756 [Homalodisca vitripennis]